MGWKFPSFCLLFGNFMSITQLGILARISVTLFYRLWGFVEWLGYKHSGYGEFRLLGSSQLPCSTNSSFHRRFLFCEVELWFPWTTFHLSKPRGWEGEKLLEQSGAQTLIIIIVKMLCYVARIGGIWGGGGIHEGFACSIRVVGTFSCSSGTNFHPCLTLPFLLKHNTAICSAVVWEILDASVASMFLWSSSDCLLVICDFECKISRCL